MTNGQKVDEQKIQSSDMISKNQENMPENGLCKWPILLNHHQKEHCE